MTRNPKERIIERGYVECVMYGMGYGHVTPLKDPSKTTFPRSDNT
jgi:hypothetical protein